MALNAGAQAPAFAITVAKAAAEWSVYLAMILLILAWVRRGRAVRFVLLDATVAALLGLALAQGIGAAWYHARPFEIGLGRQLLAHAPEASFPSDHATLLFSLAIPLLCSALTRAFGGLFLLLGLATAWARIYLGVHFPLDMLGALGVAGIAGVLAWTTRAPLHRWVYPPMVRIYAAILKWLRLPASLFPRTP